MPRGLLAAAAHQARGGMWKGAAGSSAAPAGQVAQSGFSLPPQFPRRFAAEVGEGLAISGSAVAGIADGVSEAAADEMVAEIAADAELVVADALGGVDVVDASESRNFFRCISQT